MSSQILILGAGISGLATAWFLRQALGSQVHLTIVDKNERAGGWIQTIQTEDYLFEQGPRSCRTKGAGIETLALIEALGLQNEILVPHSDAGNRYIFDGEKLQMLPRHLWEIPFNPLTGGWLKALWHDWCNPKRLDDDESVHAFFSRRLGRPWVERLIDPFISGIFAGDCSRLSLKSCFPLFDQWEQQSGSLLRGAWHHHPFLGLESPFVRSMHRFPLFSFKQGMETLPRALASSLNDCLFLNQSIRELSIESTGIEVRFQNGKRMKVDYVISTLPTFALSSMLPSHPRVMTKLKELHYTTVVIVNMGYHASVLPLKGFGYLIPSQQRSSVLGCVWDSCIFPQQNGKGHQTRLAVMMGGRHHPEVEHMTEQELVEQALHALHRDLGIGKNPRNIQVKRAHQAIPQYEIGYSKWKNEIQAELSLLTPRLILSGNAWTGISINECIGHARRLALQIGDCLNHL